MPADVKLRASFLLAELIKGEEKSPFLMFEKKEFYSKICWTLGYSSPTSAWGLIFVLLGGGLIKEENKGGTFFYKLDIRTAQKFVEAQEKKFEETRDKKVIK